jgi:hypothetical protein
MRKEYNRVDLTLDFQRRSAWIMEVVARADHTAVQGVLPIPPQRWRSTRHLKSMSVLGKMLKAVKPAWTLAATQSTGDVLPRLVLRVSDARMASLEWEDICWHVLGDVGFHFAIVRATPVRARVADPFWTPPLRFLFVTHAGETRTAELVRSVFGNLPREDVNEAIQAQEIPLPSLGEWHPSESWPTAEVVHFDTLPALHELQLLSTAAPDAIGTLGWLTRFTDTAQTRLVVIRCARDCEMRAARRLAQALVDRAGPAVVLARVGSNEKYRFFKDLYDGLLHDRPLDWLAGAFQFRPRSFSVFAGGDREEALRVSNPAVALLQLAEALDRPSTSLAVEAELHELTVEASKVAADRAIHMPSVEQRVENVKHSIMYARSEWSKVKFEDDPMEGFILSLLTLGNARDAAFGGQRAPVRLARGSATPVGASIPSGPVVVKRISRRRRRRPSGPGRFVNPSLWTDGAASARLQQTGTQLVKDRTYHLGIQVGEGDEEFVTLNAAALLEEGFKWRPGEHGVWVEVGVTGIHFDVLGDPVQEMWLPRQGESDLLRFAVVPRKEGACVLRFSLYHEQNAVQSFRLAAITLLHEAEGIPSDASAQLAAALDVDVELVGNAGWLTRLEYSRVVDQGAISSRAQRAVSIVANDADGLPVITVKGSDHFIVEFPGSVARRVRNIRRALDEIATPPIKGQPPDQWRYAFGLGLTGGAPNEGSDSTLEAALIRLAGVGWALYSQLISKAKRERLANQLDSPDRVIQVAHVLIEKVIPWSLIYDRYFTASEQVDEQGYPVRPAACLAALPDKHGVFPVSRCGEHKLCLLHHRSPNSVACPLRFWGFRHAIEIPPQQTASGDDAHPEADKVDAGRPVVLVAGLNSSLGLAETHASALEALVTEFGGSADWKVLERRGQEIVRLLNDPNLDLVYFYCHARGGEADPAIDEPCLEFVGLNDEPRRITSGDLADGSSWAHRPLVVLNGCGTVGFSPDALSPFLPIMVRDRGAAGVLGAEISVWEPLAGEFAVHFLRAFLSLESAGRALLIARRKLLAQKNPLGLVYTLYANADLKISSSRIEAQHGTLSNEWEAPHI